MMQLVLTKAYPPPAPGVVWCLAPCPSPPPRGRELRRLQSKGQRRRRRSSSSSSVRAYAKKVGLQRALGDLTQRTLEQAPYPVGTAGRDIDPVAPVPSLGAPANADNDAFAIDHGPVDQRALFQLSKEHGATQLPPDPEGIDLDPSKLEWSELGPVRSQIDAFLAFDAENGGFAAALWPSLIGCAFPSLSGMTPATRPELWQLQFTAFPVRSAFRMAAVRFGPVGVHAMSAPRVSVQVCNPQW